MNARRWEERVAHVVDARNDELDLSYLEFTDQDVIALLMISSSLPHVKRLKFTRNYEITDSGMSALVDQFLGLTHLDLSGCSKVTDAGVMAVAERLAGLTHLNLAGCPNVTDNGVIAVAKRLSNLTHLDLSACFRVTDIGVMAIAERLSNLTHLDLRLLGGITDTSIEVISRHLSRLTSLRLRWAEVTDSGVMALAERLAGLTHLDFSQCEKMTDVGIVAVAERLTGLTYLHLFGCVKVTDTGVAAVAERLAGLTHLSLSNCHKVSDVGVMAVAERLAGLTSLDLSYCNEVTDAGVMAVAERLAGLNHLNLSAIQKLTDAGVIDVAERLARLTKLNLSACQNVTDAGVMALAERLACLTQLNLSECQKVSDAGVMSVAEQIPGIEQLVLSRCLGLKNCSFETITRKLRNIISLDLSGCRNISEIPESICNLQSLKDLDLSGIEELAFLPRSLQSLGRLRWLNLSNVKALRLPTELINRTHDANKIFDYYFRSIKEGKKQLNEAKLLIVGNEAAGKSSLVEFLISNTPARPTVKTPGVAIQERINIATWDASKSEDGNPLRLNVWDFGGQEVMYETHRFFLTARSLYLLVLEARRENAKEADEVVHEWMRTIRSKARDKANDPPVIVVVNKADGGQDLRLDETRLRAEYPNLAGFVRTSCLDPASCPDGGKGIPDLRRLIVQTVREKLEHVRDWLPTSYFEVKEALGDQARQESVLNAEDYASLCRDRSIADARTQADLLDLLDKIGVVVKYDDATLLDPNWLTTAVYRLLTHADVAKAEGELTRDDLGRLLKGLPPEKYPADRWGFILEMMRRFHLCFELRDEPGRYLIPEQLNPNDPYLDWDEAGSLRFRFGYDQLPHGLIPRFIVEAHDKLPKGRCAWANGVVLVIDECRVLVRSDRKKHRVDVFVQGPAARCRGALAVVRDRFGTVHRLYSELNPRELVPHAERPDLEMSYQDLVTLEELRQEQFFFPGAGRMELVASYLDKVDEGSHRRRPSSGDRDREEDWPGDPHRRWKPRPPAFVEEFSKTTAIPDETPAISPPPVALPTRWWAPLIGPGVVGTVATLLTGLLIWLPGHPATVLIWIFAVGFGLVYLVQIRHITRMENWAKSILYLLAGTFVAASALPGLKFVADASTYGRLEVLIDNSPWVAGLAMLGMIAFGVIQFFLDRGPKGRG